MITFEAIQTLKMFTVHIPGAFLLFKRDTNLVNLLYFHEMFSFLVDRKCQEQGGRSGNIFDDKYFLRYSGLKLYL